MPPESNDPSTPPWPLNLKPFSIPRRVFPKGPILRQDIARLNYDQLSQLEVTKDNVHQIAYFGVHLTASDMEAQFGPMLELEKISPKTEESLTRSFADWPSNKMEDILPVFQHYKIVFDNNGLYPRAYIPPVYFIDENSLVIQFGPFLAVPGRDPQVKFARPLSTGLMSEEVTRPWKTGTHPHVSNGANLCLGTEVSAYISQRRAGDNLGALLTIESVLGEYNPQDPYRSITKLYPSKITAPQVPSEVSFCFEEDTGSFYTKRAPKASREIRSIGGMVLNLSESELNFALRDVFRFVRFIKDAAELSSALDQKEMLQNVLPEGSSHNERIENAGFTLRIGFNQEDKPLSAVTTPTDRRTLLHVPDPSEFKNETTTNPSFSEEAHDDEEDDDDDF